MSGEEKIPVAITDIVKKMVNEIIDLKEEVEILHKKMEFRFGQFQKKLTKLERVSDSTRDTVSAIENTR